jgi:hypothetical protein
MDDIVPVRVLVEAGTNKNAELLGCMNPAGECKVNIRRDSPVLTTITARPVIWPKLTITQPSTGTITVDPACASSPCNLQPGKEYTFRFEPKDSLQSWTGCFQGRLGEGTCTITAQGNRDYDVGVKLSDTQ